MSNRRMITGLFGDRDSVKLACQLLSSLGYGVDDVWLVMSDDARREWFAVDDTEVLSFDKSLGLGSSINAGQLLAAIVSVGNSLSLPGTGLFVAGPIVAALAGAGVGLPTGSLIGTLAGAGLSEGDAKRADNAVRNGGIVIAVSARSDSDAQQIESAWAEARVVEEVNEVDRDDRGAEGSRERNLPPTDDGRGSTSEPPTADHRPDDEIQYKTITAWVSERAVEPKKPLRMEETYLLNFQVGEQIANNFITSPEAKVPQTDIPEEGLDTTWIVSSWTVELAPAQPSDKVAVERSDSPAAWSAIFSLHIPKHAASAVRQLRITPRSASGVELNILILVREAPYRKFRVVLNVEADPPPEHTAKGTAVIIDKMVIHSPAVHAGLRPPHEWQTPPGRLLLTVFGQGFARVDGRVPGGNVHAPFQWSAPLTLLAGPIKNLRESAETFRVAFSDHLNDIEPPDLNRRLDDLKRDPGKFWEDGLADAEHQQLWDERIAHSPELLQLAYNGFVLYRELFPDGSNIRALLDTLEPGWRLDITWSSRLDAGWLANFPWGLLYTVPPALGQPIDPMNFWGLRHRINYIAYDLETPKSAALGELDQIGSAFGFYWGDQPGDREIADESMWQHSNWSRWTNQTFIPDESITTAPKDQLVQLLNYPSQRPLPVLYFFCQCDVGDGNKPVLRFGSTKQPPDNLRDVDLGLAPFKDQPLVFVNACESVGSDPYIANQLEQIFFRRRCRAYLGTEIKVPVRMASRFAAVFYQFFYREVDKKPMAAGEAVYQTRQFLWRNYRNMGGLFYAYINDYDIYIATDAEVGALGL